jgi:hypothetical protein
MLTPASAAVLLRLRDDEPLMNAEGLLLTIQDQGRSFTVGDS